MWLPGGRAAPRGRPYTKSHKPAVLPDCTSFHPGYRIGAGKQLGSFTYTNLAR